MSRDKNNKTLKPNKLYVLPSDNDELTLFIKQNKIQLTEQTLSSIEDAIITNADTVSVFKFNKTDFVVSIPKEDFLKNVEHIYNFYVDTELYELCPRAVKLQNTLKSINNHNEKKIKNNGV